MTYRISALGLTLVAAAWFGLTGSAQQQDLNDKYEKAIKEAAKKVGPSVVQIQTLGGAEMVVTSPKGPIFRKALGPTTGVVVDADGYIISSAFNFLNNPTTILVFVPGETEPLKATRVATDKSRMLTLLKVEKNGLKVPAFVPSKDIKVGQSAVAMGRTLESKAGDMRSDQPPSISYGIISAVGRIWGKAIQTDAKVSPVNYGGPIVDVSGRVQGIIVPASPRGDDLTAGYEWYDSGIGFAIPMEDVMAVVPRLKKGKDLNKAVLGIKLTGGDEFGVIPVIASVAEGSPAEKAGLKQGDKILEVEGKEVKNHAQILHLIGPKYEGDTISLKVERGKETIAVAKLELMSAAKDTRYVNAFLGILPIRDDAKLGVAVRYVYPKSPAATAGFKEGDRIVKYGAAGKLQGFKGEKRGKDELLDFLGTQKPGSEIALEVNDKEGKAKPQMKIKLAAMPGSKEGEDDFLPEKLPELATVKKALEPLETAPGVAKQPKVDPKMPATGMLKRTNAAGDRKYWVYVNSNYNPQIAHAVVVWLHLPGKNTDKENDAISEGWDKYCEDNNIILVGPITDNDGGWTPNDTELVIEAVRDVIANYTVDKDRIVAHGSGNGGEMAFNLGFKARDLFRGVAAHSAIWAAPPDNLPQQRLAFWVSGGQKDPVIKAIAETRTKLQSKGFPVLYQDYPNRGHEYFDDNAFVDMIRWIDALDRM
jgi:S1-C subfamily serine protease